MAEIRQKPWFKSFSTWVSIITAILGAIVELTTKDVVPPGTLVASLAPMLLNIAKRWSNENTVMRANAMVEAAKQNPSPPSP